MTNIYILVQLLLAAHMLLTIDEAPVHVYMQELLYDLKFLPTALVCQMLLCNNEGPVNVVFLLRSVDNSIERQVSAFPSIFCSLFAS